MITEWEIWACADHVLKRYGARAPEHAAARAALLAQAGDSKGALVWRRIGERIAALATETPVGTVQ